MQVFNSRGTFLRQWGKASGGDSSKDNHVEFDLKYPTSIEVSKRGEVVVAHQGRHKIDIFDISGNYRCSRGGEAMQKQSKERTGEFANLSSVAVHEEEREVYATDRGRNCVNVFSLC